MGRKPKPDDRRDNVEKIQENINNTIENIEAAEDMLARQTILNNAIRLKKRMKEEEKLSKVCVKKYVMKPLQGKEDINKRDVRCLPTGKTGNDCVSCLFNYMPRMGCNPAVKVCCGLAVGTSA